ncbi:MAG TPA: anaerobic ribonucleoside-triphosphate reductase activating protein [Candidatus Sumerlaeota bacterium]|nr:anaerobic ribonucleoside-triphosphate reductase activating protein [Candidatus Sumerlaeota bacterium]
MKIAGLRKCSMVDYPGKMAAVIFTPGCNLDCYYCHNRFLLEENALQDEQDPQAVLAVLARRRGFLDGVVISGGEPTLQPDLERFILDVRELGFPVKLDTNGLRPDVLQELLQSRLLDYVAMDLKASRAKYRQLCGRNADVDLIDRSIRLLLESDVRYEFRTTVAPELDGDDLREMSEWIAGARHYVLQQYRPLQAEWFGDQERLSAPPHEPATLLEWARAIAPRVRQLSLRGLGVETVGERAASSADEDEDLEFSGALSA